MKFKIEQVALYPADPDKAKELLCAIGLDEWAIDNVFAFGEVFGNHTANEAQLSFNYQSTRGVETVLDDDNNARTAINAGVQTKPLELEVLKYKNGANWLDYGPARHQRKDPEAPMSVASHLGMHCSAEELVQWRAKFAELGIAVAQEVLTTNHTNPAIAGKRWYNYVIFDTRDILGIDLKFIVRQNEPPKNNG